MESKDKSNTDIISIKKVNDDLIHERLKATGLLTKSEAIEERRIFKRFKHNAVFSKINETSIGVDEVLQLIKKEHSVLSKVKWIVFKVFLFLILVILINNGIIDKEWFNFLNTLN